MPETKSASAPIRPRPASTVVVLRDADRGFEVLMLRRPASMAFAGNAFVFPGGAVDDSDRAGASHALALGLDDPRASERLGIAEGGLPYWIAALRECFEEAGLLYAADPAGALLRAPFDTAEAQLAAMRRVAEGTASFADIVSAARARMAVDRLAYYSHWVTQAGRPRRFDTRFFVSIAPEAQRTIHNPDEAEEHVWITPREAIERNRQGSFNLLFPTLKTLESFARFGRAADVLDYAHTPRRMPAMEPRSATGREGTRFLVPGDYAFAEVGKLDPHNAGTASYEIRPGLPVRLSGRVRRLTAANPGMMTGPGTNTYLIGDDATGIAVIDPGPLMDEHVDAIVEHAGGPIRWILCTHTHIDHSPAATPLQARTGARTFGMVATYPERQDQTFRPDHVLVEGERLSIAGCTLRALHTPGHASNQFCFLLEEEKLLFTGDHIMQGSTVVINPPDGDMLVYFRALERLYAEDVEYLAPGHGFLMDKPHEMVERLIVHRRARENKVVNALREAGIATVEALVPKVYDDTPSRLHEVAARSLLAHLVKLETEGRAARTKERWQLTGDSSAA